MSIVRLAFFFALAISLVCTAVLWLAYQAPYKFLLSTALVSFLSCFLLLHMLLNNIFGKETLQLEKEMKKMRKKGYGVSEQVPDFLFPPLKKIAEMLYDYARIREAKIADLQRAASFRREFLANVSHELKTPLFAAQGFVDTLLEETHALTPIHVSFLRKAAANLERLNRLVQDLMMTTRMESGAITMHFNTFDLHAMCKDLLDSFQHQAKKKNVQLFLAPTDHDSSVYADPKYIRQVISNLISNAILYNYKNGEVQLSLLQAPEDRITLQVQDTGKGIPKKELGRIFERFYRVEKSRSKKQGGAGIGLALVKHILEAHESSPQVTSQKGKGSSFSFSLKKAKIPSVPHPQGP